MRNLVFPLVLLTLPAVVHGGCSNGGTAPQTPLPVPTSDPQQPWRLVFSDEFERDGLPDASKWAYEFGMIRNNEAQFYTRQRLENARVENGVLVIEARKEEYQGARYTSASVITRNRAHFRYAKAEVRAKLPTGRGTWPAVWMLGANIDAVGWPACGEVDIMENVGFDPLRVHVSVHTRRYNWVAGTQRTASRETEAPWENFHVYAIEWLPDRIDFLLDEQKVMTFGNEGTGLDAWPFDGEMYLLINLAIGGGWGGERGIDDALFPHRYYVDYVRIYQKQ